MPYERESRHVDWKNAQSVLHAFAEQPLEVPVRHAADRVTAVVPVKSDGLDQMVTSVEAPLGDDRGLVKAIGNVVFPEAAELTEVLHLIQNTEQGTVALTAYDAQGRTWVSEAPTVANAGFELFTALDLIKE